MPTSRSRKPRKPRSPARRSAARPGRFVILTGLSGAGKSQAMRALEDLGYFCVDNLPTTLIPTLAELTLRAGGAIRRAAVIVDVREGRFLAEFPRVYRRLRAMRELRPVLIFLEATDAALVRRFSETRRPHPLAPHRSVLEGIREEREQLDAIRRMADRIIDTSDMTAHELRQTFMRLTRGRADEAALVVTLISFGFKHGLPLDADLVLDVRFLPNPHFVPSLRPLSGRDRRVLNYVTRYDVTRAFLDQAARLLEFLIPQYIEEGKRYLSIAIGCTGGRHRSVAISELLRPRLAALDGVRLRVRHRDIANE